MIGRHRILFELLKKVIREKSKIIVQQAKVQ